MTRPAGQVEPSDSPILHDAIAMAAQILACCDQIERERRLPAAVVQTMKDAGVFGMAMPLAWGGPELDPLTQFRVIEALAMADGSAGWCAMINCDGGYITAFLNQDVGRVLYADIQAPTAAAATTTGQATRVPNGYRVSGRFSFASGCQHCDWVGSDVPSSTTERRSSIATVYQRPASACSGYPTAKSSIRGSPLACAVPAVTIFVWTMCSFRQSAQ